MKNTTLQTSYYGSEAQIYQWCTPRAYHKSPGAYNSNYSQPTTICQIEVTSKEIRLKQNKGHFWAQWLWKVLVWPYLGILIFWIFWGCYPPNCWTNQDFSKRVDGKNISYNYFVSSLLAYCHTQLLYIPGSPIAQHFIGECPTTKIDYSMWKIFSLCNKCFK